MRPLAIPCQVPSRWFQVRRYYQRALADRRILTFPILISQKTSGTTSKFVPPFFCLRGGESSWEGLRRVMPLEGGLPCGQEDHASRTRYLVGVLIWVTPVTRVLALALLLLLPYLPLKYNRLRKYLSITLCK